jgi:hypothetical protein
MANPAYVKLDKALPSDTVTLTVESLTLMLTASASDPGKLLPQIVLNTNELGCYRILMNRENYATLVSQIEWITKLTPQQLPEIADTLNNGKDTA